MTEPDVTIIVVPRERFSLSRASLDSVYERTDVPFELVYVDAGSPQRHRRRLAALALRRGFVIARSEKILSPNQARNVGLTFVRTPYVVFMDNDVIVEPGWLGPLLACAEETGAALVGPLYLEGRAEDRIIHMAGGELEIAGEPGHRKLVTSHLLQGTKMDDAPMPLVRRTCDYVEFHCMLARTEIFQDVGPLDEDLLGTREHLDLCMGVRADGGEVYLEPGSVVTYSTPPPLALVDVPFFARRWSDAWMTHSLNHFCDKHGLDASYKGRISIARGRRKIMYEPLQRAAGKVLGSYGPKLVENTVGRIEPRFNRWLVRSP
jgi:GT2 family glycosyltransferase